MKPGIKEKHLTVKPFPVLLIAFTVLVMMHTATTPVFEAPDEVWHYNYVRWLAEGHGLPLLKNDKSGANQEAAQPPFYYALAAVFTAPFQDYDLSELFWQNPGFGYQSSSTDIDNKNMLIHTAREHWPWHGAVATIHVARLTSLIFGLWTLIAAWYLGIEVFHNRKSALILASLIAFHPQFVFISSVVSNDSATAALCTTALWSIVHAIRKQLTLSSIIWSGISIGLAILCKTSAVLLIPLAGGAFFYWAIRTKMSLVAIIKRLVIFSFCVLAVGGWWYVRNMRLYGDPMALANHIDTPWGRSMPVSYLQLLPEMPLLLRSFWAAYGWGHISWPDIIIYVLTIASGLTIVSGMVNLIRLPRPGQTQHTTVSSPNVVVPTSMVPLLAWAWLGMIFIALLSWMRQVEAPHGRLLFPAIGAYGLIMAYGLVYAHKIGGYKKRLAHLFLGLLAVLSILAAGARIIPTFAPPRLKPITDTRTSINAPYVTYSGVAKVFDVDFKHDTYAPGDSLRIRACWEALQPMRVDYSVFIHLLGPGNARAAERHTYPGLGRYPTSLWESGQFFCDTYNLRIEAWAPTPVLYQIEIGLFDAENGDRLQATNPLGQPQEPPIVGTVPVIDISTPPVPSNPLRVIFEDQIMLNGVDSPPTAEAGDTITVTLYWEALQTPSPQLITFVHLWQPSTPEPVAQDDGIPNQGWFPTDVWRKGLHVQDPHVITIPATIQPGMYPLWAGIYRAADSLRLQAVGTEGRYVNDLVPIGEIEIQ
jgi:hypothetical protein